MIPKTILDGFGVEFLIDLDAFWDRLLKRSGIDVEMIVATKPDRNF